MQHFFEACAEIEETVSRIYEQLATLEGIDERLRQIWLLLAGDELDHAAQIRLAGRIAENGVDANVPLDEVERLLRRAEGLLEQVSERHPNLEEALRLSLELEREFGSIHAHCAIRFADSQTAAMFKALAWHDEQHSRAIREYCRAWAPDALREEAG